MSKKMLIDARHPEETRVALLSNNKVEDFDFESIARKPLRGNIYLARITRVEPSLQAAFVEYGGNRHGFLAFGEIHPDYYQIPVADREILREADTLEAELAEKLGALDKEPDGDEAENRRFRDPDEADAGDDDDSAQASDSDEQGEEPKPERRGRRRGRRRRGRGRQGENTAAANDDAENTEAAAEAHADGTDAEAHANATPTESDGSEAVAPVADDSDDASDTTPEPPTAALKDVAPATVAQDLTDEIEAGAEEDVPPADAELEAADETVVADIEEPVADTAEEVAEEPVAEETAAPTAEEPVAEVSSEDDAPAEEAEAKQEAEPTPEEIEAASAAADEAAKIADLEKRYGEAKRARDKLLRNYRIQEVMKRRQIILIQVVKEERGNKGAAVTTYLSLAGRYGVLMPNNARGGGVSRKITNTSDRRRLRKAIAELKVPMGQGLIIRTAGAKRTKAEIKRDYDYLARLWDTIREQTMKSIAPCLVYEEASLIKRAIRDLYDKDTGEILVDGEDGYREAKDFMKMLMPSHAKNVQPYKEPVPLFLRHGVEQQLDEMYQPVVTLKSGGYLVIQQTEALISIDVNSGKATKERNVEATALKTNSEAAVEVARQCRLRDLAGLVVIDFIDMEENKNNRTVEKKLKDAMKSDRARIQIGNISGFGLLEMSRQRRRSGIVDGTTMSCPTCDGAGAVRSPEMAALRILRSIEAVVTKDRPASVKLSTCHEVALYILNEKRAWLNKIEETHGVRVEIASDPDKAGDQFDISKSGQAPERESLRQTTQFEHVDEPSTEEADDKAQDAVADGEEKPKKRRRRRKKSDETTDAAEKAEAPEQAEEGAEPEGEAQAAEASEDSSEDDDEKPKKRRRRGRRGGRRTRKTEGDAESGDAGENAETSADAVSEDSSDSDTAAAPEQTPEPVIAEATESATQSEAAPVAQEPSASDELAVESAPAQDQPAPAARSNEPKRGGWWQRALGGKK